MVTAVAAALPDGTPLIISGGAEAGAGVADRDGTPVI